MPRRTPDGIPQIVTIVSLTAKKQINLKKAARQHAANGSFPAESYGSGLSQVGFLELFARYDHPISKVVVLRALPWIVEAQNETGSWGEANVEDAGTLAVITALLGLRDLLPSGMKPF